VNRQEFVQRARLRAIELAIIDPELDLRDAERQAALELKAIAKRSLEVRGSVAAPKAKPSGARARLASALSVISARMSAAAAVIPRAHTPAPPVKEAQSKHRAANRGIAAIRCSVDLRRRQCRRCAVNSRQRVPTCFAIHPDAKLAGLGRG
jgi:hypothetical protein